MVPLSVEISTAAFLRPVFLFWVWPVHLDLLHDWRERYKPTTPEEPLDERFVEALHMTETVEHLTDCVAFGTPQQKAAAAAQLLSGSYLLMLEERTDRLALAKCA